MRRNWIKLYVDQCLRGTMMDEMKDPGERFLWFAFLLLAGDSPYEGKIALTEEMGYSDEQIGSLLKCEPGIVTKAKKIMVKYDKIKILENNVIQIVNWKKYQSEYQRQKIYRGDKKEGVTTESDNPKLQTKVTPKGDEQDRDRDKKEIRIEEDINTYTEEFSQFWDYYNFKVAKQDALKAYKALRRKGETFDNIMDAAKGYFNHLKNEKIHNNFEKNQMYPATFLRNGKFKDFIGVKYRPPM